MAALHLELARGSTRDAPAGKPFIDGCQRLCATLPTKLLGVDGYPELNRAQFVSLSCELGEVFPRLRGEQVQAFKDVCLVANCSEEFFLSASEDQWLRTAIFYDERSPNALFSSSKVKINGLTPSDPFSSDAVSISIHSKVVPYWPNELRGKRDAQLGVPSKRVYFPSTFLDFALSQEHDLVEKLHEWEEREKECAALVELCLGSNRYEGSGRPFWNIGSDDVEVVKRKFEEGSQAYVGKILWRGGIFASKVFYTKQEFDTELDVVRRVSHPHIVYCFGMSIHIDEKQQEQHSLLMELLDCDLFLLIKDRVREVGRSKPPFPQPDSVHILLQVAKAMEYMHGLREPVIHGDLKPQNILVSKCGILGDVCLYFVKVADFGSARIQKPSPTSFRSHAGTTKYAAPEVLEARLDKELVIYCPQKIDVYSFGIVAFEVLTGLEPYKKSSSVLVEKEGVKELVPYEGFPSSRPSQFKAGIIAGTLRPPLREACKSLNFWSDRPDLISLIESCWHRDPSIRPCFSEVTSQLESIYNDLTQRPTSESIACSPPQVNGVDDAQAKVVLDAPQVHAVDDAPQKQANGSSVHPLTQGNIVSAPQEPLNRSDGHPPLQANVIDDAPQSSSTRNGRSLPEVNQVNAPSTASQVGAQK